ncbi:MAG TPA: hypothetical protein VM452_20355 [Caulifigura sp.]|jgi:hypothetical protein|nr:hypothetical protein [Caulifigura sp.]
MIERSQRSRLLIAALLPKRGWYLSGEEPGGICSQLASLIQQEKWSDVDIEVMEHLPDFNLDGLRAWLNEEGVPDYSVNRLMLCLDHHSSGRYEEATFLGVPLLDELAFHLYGGKSFTTKRGKTRSQSKPELAIATSNGPELEGFCANFVQTFGSLQEDTDPTRLGDEDYWNRHAIVHGLMQRAMGLKDSAKCLMAFKFLLCARKEDVRT